MARRRGGVCCGTSGAPRAHIVVLCVVWGFVIQIRNAPCLNKYVPRNTENPGLVVHADCPRHHNVRNKHPQACNSICFTARPPRRPLWPAAWVRGACNEPEDWTGNDPGSARLCALKRATGGGWERPQVRTEGRLEVCPRLGIGQKLVPRRCSRRSQL